MMYKYFIVLLLLPTLCLCQTKRIAEIDDYVRGEHLQGFNGNVLVAQKGKIIYQKAFGYRDFPRRQALNNSSVFELASLSKQFTATGILMLKAKGKLRLTDTLGMYFPELKYPPITIYQLLTHTSGLPDYLEEMDKLWNHNRIAFNKDVVSFLANQHPALYFTPGSKYEYSNTGYVLLASIIEKLTGQTYNEYLKRNIFKPLQMNNSLVYNWRRSRGDTIKNYAYGYVLDHNSNNYILPDSLKQDDFVYWLDGVTGDGTVNSTTDDLLKWSNAMLTHQLLSPDNQKDMVSHQVLADTVNKRYYGFGIENGTDELGAFLTHNGSWPGYSTALSYYFSGEFTIIVLSNNQFNASGISKGLGYLLKGKQVVMPYLHKQIHLEPSILKWYIGRYAFPAKIEIVERNEKLYRHLPGRSVDSDVELWPESLTKLFYGNKTDIQLDFQFDSKNQIIGVFVINCGIRSRGVKIN